MSALFYDANKRALEMCMSLTTAGALDDSDIRCHLEVQVNERKLGRCPKRKAI